MRSEGCAEVRDVPGVEQEREKTFEIPAANGTSLRTFLMLSGSSNSQCATVAAATFISHESVR